MAELLDTGGAVPTQWSTSSRGGALRRPGWVLAGWAVLLSLDIWAVYARKPITYEDIQRELHAGR